MKTFAAKDKRSAPAVRNARPYVHHPKGPVQQAQQAAMRKILRPDEVQAKPDIGEPDSKHEQEADHVAADLPVPAISGMLGGAAPLQRSENEEPEEELQRQPEEEEEEPIQAKLIQRQPDNEEEEEPVQAKRIQRQMADMRGIRLSRFGYVGPEVKAQQAEISRILRSTGAQAKLTVGQPNDEYEQEVDRIADQVMAMPDPKLQRQPENDEEEGTVQAKPVADQITPLVQRQEEPPEEEERAQAKEDGGCAPSVSTSVENSINTIRRGGSPLSESTRSFFEPRFGTDFSGVRIHTDSNANHLARSINSKAFTVGQDVVFGSGQYSPGSRTGRSLLAHEMTHVVQQSYPRKARIMRKYSCLYPNYPGMGGLPYRGNTWYPHDFVGPIQTGDVRPSQSSSGYDVPSSPSSLYNCMRWAVGHGVPTSREWWQGVTRTSSVPWPEEKFLKDKGCSKISAAGKSDHKVKLYEYKHEDQFHIVRQETDGAWSSKTGNGPLYRGITSPDVHTAGHYKPMSEMKPTHWSCP
jgi:hypothetical protein